MPPRHVCSERVVVSVGRPTSNIGSKRFTIQRDAGQVHRRLRPTEFLRRAGGGDAAEAERAGDQGPPDGFYLPDAEARSPPPCRRLRALGLRGDGRSDGQISSRRFARAPGRCNRKRQGATYKVTKLVFGRMAGLLNTVRCPAPRKVNSADLSVAG